jgi:hemerythrin-like metal-binding protein
MAFFEWAEDFVIDKGPIDADHLQLVALVNELHTATTQGTGHDVAGGIIDLLIGYTRQHFTREEQIMASARFPGLVEHQAAHQQIILQIDTLKRKHDDGSITVASQLSTLLRDWLSVHIRRSDKELLFFLKKGEKN